MTSLPFAAAYCEQICRSRAESADSASEFCREAAEVMLWLHISFDSRILSSIDDTAAQFSDQTAEPQSLGRAVALRSTFGPPIANWPQPDVFRYNSDLPSTLGSCERLWRWAVGLRQSLHPTPPPP